MIRIETFVNVNLTKRYQLGPVYRRMHLPDMAISHRMFKNTTGCMNLQMMEFGCKPVVLEFASIGI